MRAYRAAAGAALSAALCLLGPVSVAHAANSRGAKSLADDALPRLAGRTLVEALGILQGRGWAVVFSSRLVRDSMRVTVEPAGATPRAVLADLLRPHGLAVRDGAHDRLVVVAGAPPRPDPAPGPPPAPSSRRSATLPGAAPATMVQEEIVVTPGRDTARGSSIVPLTVEPGGSAPPRLGDDALSAVSILPGASSAGGSTKINVRGGADDEVLVLLDGLELVTPYHLGDFDSAVSLMTPSSVERAELFTGGYPAQYGDRMSGVLDLTTRMPSRQGHYSLGLDVLHAEGAASGRFEERGRWLATGRAGSYQWPLEVSGRDEHPRYWDAFGKLDLDLGPRQTLIGEVLVAHDQFELSSENRSGADSYRSEWDNRYAWVRHSAVLGRDLYVESLLGSGQVARDRAGRLDSLLGGEGNQARERRDLDLTGARQDWEWEAGHVGALKWGFDVKRTDTLLDFWSDRELAVPFAGLRGEPALGGDGVLRRFDSTHVAGYASTQIHPLRALSLELGLRHDTDTLSDETHLSPRLAAAWEIGPRSVLRAAWGWFYQSQRPYELQVEEGMVDGNAWITSERAEHHVLSFEHQLEHGLTLQVDAYRRRMEDPRPRFENLFDPLLVFPELGSDRVRVEPGDGTAQGVELTLRRPQRRHWGWWMTYVRSSVVEEIDGVLVPRSIDQPDSFRAGLSFRPGRSWEVDLLGQYHTGWPTTLVEASRVDGPDGTAQWIPVLGPRNGERLPNYHRLDLRLGRSWALGPGRLSAHLDLLDVYDRQNLRGFEDLRLEPDGAGGMTVARTPVRWTGFLPAVGVRFDF